MCAHLMLWLCLEGRREMVGAVDLTGHDWTVPRRLVGEGGRLRYLLLTDLKVGKRARLPPDL